MALCIYFPVEGMSAEKYDEILQKLEAAGAGAPPGRSYHVSFKMGGGLQVVDVWDSQETFDAFGQTLMPILAEVGVDPGEPAVGEVHNIIVSRRPRAVAIARVGAQDRAATFAAKGGRYG